jgi:flagellar basal-body rod protein FlgB
VFIDAIISADSLPTLQAAARFAAQRHQVILSNIANLSTPGYQTKDVSVRAFQSQLAEAVERKRQGGPGTPLELQSTDEVRVTGGSPTSFTLNPSSTATNVLFHDRNNRDLERAMQDLSENAAAFRLATDLLKNRVALLEAAIRERS